MGQPFAAGDERRFCAGAELDDIAPFGSVALTGAEAEPLIILDGQIHLHPHDIEQVIALQIVVHQT